MKDILLRNKEGYDYRVSFVQEYNHYIKFTVYPCIVSDDFSISYRDKNDSQIDIDEFIPEKILSYFSGSVCWRGVWETRIYFHEEEYWGEDFTTMHNAWKRIQEVCKEKISEFEKTDES